VVGRPRPRAPCPPGQRDEDPRDPHHPGARGAPRRLLASGGCGFAGADRAEDQPPQGLGEGRPEALHQRSPETAVRTWRSRSFYSLVNKNGPSIRPELGPRAGFWLGSRNRQGYGWIRVNGLHLAGPPGRPSSLRATTGFSLRSVSSKSATSVTRPECVRVSHLKIWTPQDDADDKRSKDRQTRGERHHLRRKLRQQDVDEIRRLFTR